MKLNAYAKINLTLDITGKRADGYHLLKTVMQTVSLCDEVTVEKADKITLSCSNSTVPTDEKNTAIKAAKAFFEFTGISGGAKIHIEKNIPSEAGMGGASADAATVLKALNELYNANLSNEDLLKIGLSVGADVPFCLVGATALCKGVGEEISPLENMPTCYIVIAQPDSGISTKAAYDAYDNGDYDDTGYTDKLLENFDSLNGIASTLGNIFEELANNPDIDIIKMQMKSAGALGACMTGSGSVVFGIFDDKNKAEFCVKELSEDYKTVCLTKPQFKI